MTAGAVLAAVAPGLLRADDRCDRPNVILILGDDLSAKELGCYGSSDIRTPTLDSLAATGVMFRTAWTSPLCGPSRSLLRTGLYACHTNYYENAIVPHPPTYKTHPEIGHVMKKAGYATATYGKLHDGGDPKDYGYDEYCCTRYWKGYDGPDQGQGNTTEGMYAVQWYWHPGLVANGKGIPTKASDFGPDMEVEQMLDFMRRKKNEPFFIFWPTNLPHMEHVKGGKWRYTSVPDGKGGAIPGSLKADVEYLDGLVKRILAALDDLDLRKKTVVMFAGDNGTAGYGKGKLDSEVGPHVPFIVNCPGLVRKIGASDVLTDFTDVLPTLADLAGCKLDTPVDGHSLTPLLTGKRFTPRDYIFTQLGEARWIRDSRWLLDGNGRFWDCGTSREEWKGYKDVTESTDHDVIAARKRFEQISKRYPQPDLQNQATAAAWKKYLESRKPFVPYKPPYL